jgi:hypothetical protein
LSPLSRVRILVFTWVVISLENRNLTMFCFDLLHQGLTCELCVLNLADHNPMSNFYAHMNSKACVSETTKTHFFLSNLYKNLLIQFLIFITSTSHHWNIQNPQLFFIKFIHIKQFHSSKFIHTYFYPSKILTWH